MDIGAAANAKNTPDRTAIVFDDTRRRERQCPGSRTTTGMRRVVLCSYSA